MRALSPITHIIILSSSLMLSLSLVKSNSSIVYAKCSNQTHDDSTTSHSNALSSLLQQLIAQSSTSKFSKATAGDEKTGISGLYQCRGDLRSQECYNCVNTLPYHMSNYKICEQAMAARVQLDGCYFEYEADGFENEERPKHELLHEECSEKKAEEGGFVEVRDAALLAMENYEEMWEKGFYEGDYENVHVIGQCDGDLRGCDCIECAGTAVEFAQQHCGSSFSGKIYLDKCFLSYAYLPDSLYPDGENRNKGDDTGKKVAILLGAAAALGGGFILLKLIQSKCKKEDT